MDEEFKGGTKAVEDNDAAGESALNKGGHWSNVIALWMRSVKARWRLSIVLLLALMCPRVLECSSSQDTQVGVE